jgi:hypothetical protein
VQTLELHVNEKGVGALCDILPPMRATSEKVVTAGADGVVSPPVSNPSAPLHHATTVLLLTSVPSEQSDCARVENLCNNFPIFSNKLFHESQQIIPRVATQHLHSSEL